MDIEKYNPKDIEPKGLKFWAENLDLYQAKDDSEKPKKFILDMFPYPSGEGLHTGHVESYTATDIMARYLRAKGYNVLHPQGWDAFGLPAENFAIKTQVHPTETTKKAIANFKRQMNMVGLSYDWSREVNSSDPDYYRFTQWFFLLLYKNGLAYKAKAKVNWCESCKTVLANEQVENGLCERCKNPVIQKDLEQWFFKITDFIEDKKNTSGLLAGLDKLDWPESTKAAQKNWIGKSEGATVKFSIFNSQFSNNDQLSDDEILKPYVEVFTTRVDTIYGATYVVLAPEHKLITELKDHIENYEEIQRYIQETKKKSDLNRMESKEKTGVEIKGIKVVNPFNKEELPLWVADYVLVQYGTGAVMAVPAHDERDFEFAKKYDLPIKKVVIPPFIGTLVRDTGNIIVGGWQQYSSDIKDWTGDGELINSQEYSGLTSEKAREKMVEWLKENNLGSKKINYKLRDWLVSRQRYWGAPIPIIYCEKCGTVPVPEADLPVKLPDDVDFKPTGESPLKYSKKFHEVRCPVCGGKAKRESDTMDTFVCSSWYYFRYADPKNDKEFAEKELIKKWLPVDLYVGGAEHTVLHLLYSRFFTKVLHNLGYIDFDEPFTKLRHQGIILSEDGRKMSKSLGNVVNPDDEVKRWGADALRLFEMFMGPLEDMKPWQTNGLVGVYRFLEKVWKLQGKISNFQFPISDEIQNSNDQSPKLKMLIHKSIKKVSEDIESLRFNTAISQLMILTNEMEKESALSATSYAILVQLLSPFAPFIAEELWHRLGHTESIFKEKWPEFDPELIKDAQIELVIQVNGKVRDRIKTAADIAEEEAKKLALGSEKAKASLGEKEIKKIVYVKGKLVNIVVN